MAPPGPRQDERRFRRLLQKLEASSRRFASVMGTLVAKYDKPFEGDQLVNISTLTYETPDGLRVWGGRIVTQESFQNIQTSLEKEEYSIDGIKQSPFTDVKSNGFNETLVQRNGDISLKGDSLRSLPENYLNKKYMTRVDVILEDDHPRMIMFDGFSKIKAPKSPKILSTEDSPKALLGCSGNDPRKNYRIPVKPTSAFQCPQDNRVVAVPPNQSLLAWRARRNGFSEDTVLQDEEFSQDLTLSDLYAEMLCSLCKCLPSQKMGLISTKKYVSKGWFPRMRKLNVTLTMESSFLKNNQTFQVTPGEKNSLIFRKDCEQNILPCSEPDTIVKGSKLLTTDSSPLALKGSLPNHSSQASSSRTRAVKQDSPSQSHMGSWSPATPRLCLPPALMSAKERFRPLLQGTPERDVLGQERYLSRALVTPRMLQTPKNAPLSQERPKTCPKIGFPREKVTKARKSLPFCMEQKPCKAQDVIDSMFDTYSQETTQWAQELLFLKKSGRKSKVLTQSKSGDSLEGSGFCDDSQSPQKAASPRSITRDTLRETVTTLYCIASPRATSKGDFSSPTKRRKVSSP